VQPAAPTPPDAAAEGEWLEERLRTWIADLPTRQREALVLSRFEGLSHDQIAEVMDISPRTVNNHIVRALKRLRDHVDDYDEALADLRAERREYLDQFEQLRDEIKDAVY